MMGNFSSFSKVFLSPSCRCLPASGSFLMPLIRIHWAPACAGVTHKAFHALMTGVAILVVNTAGGQAYPTKPIRIVAAETGGSSDYAARVIAQGLTASLGQPVIVQNRGGSVVIQAELVTKAPPDGYSLMLNGSTIWLHPFLQDKAPYDPLRDLSPVTLATRSPNILAVNPAVAVKSIAELLVLARAKPGELNYGSGLAGGSNHLAAELFKSMAIVNIVRVTYKGTGPALTALVSGEVQLMFAPAGSVVPHAKSGRLRALAVTSAQPSALIPALPTIAASGLPGYEAVSMLGLFTTTGTPTAVTSRLEQEVARIVNAADVREKFLSVGMETVGSTREQLGTIVKADMSRMGKVIRDAGISGE